MFTRFLTPQFIADVRQAVDSEPRLMLGELAGRLGVPEGAVAQALPPDMRAFAPASAFDLVWEAMTSWEAVTFITVAPGLVLEFKGALPRGSHGHGMFNLHDEGHPLGGHFMIGRLGAICFLSKPFFGLESHSVQFYDQDGAAMCAVYVGRQGKKAHPRGPRRLPGPARRGLPGGGRDMRCLIVYSSRTGNTAKVARAVRDVLPLYADFHHVDEAPDPSDYDFVAMGFWVDKGAPDAEAQAYMRRIRGKRVGLFGTLGAWPDSDHARECLARADELLEGNDIRGSFLCQGRIDPRIIEVMQRNGPGDPPHDARTRGPHPRSRQAPRRYGPGTRQAGLPGHARRSRRNRRPGGTMRAMTP